MSMTPEAKRKLSQTVRALRTRLLDDLHATTEGAYRLSVPAAKAELQEEPRVRRERFEAWIEEQARAEVEAQVEKKRKSTWSDDKVKKERDALDKALRKAGLAERFRREAEKQAAYTLLNRLVLLKLMEKAELRSPPVVTGGWESRGYKDFRGLAPALAHGDATEGYALLLRLVFDDLATELPGLFGPAGVADLVPLDPATLRHVVEELDDKELETCWSDDMTLGWVYQYWNDPEREVLDAKLNAGGKVEPHEIASKTQMFTERYMVDWLLQNSLGPLWLAMCKRHGWEPECQSSGVLDGLEARRVEWREKRDKGEVELTALMPLHSELERRWAYYLPQPLPDDAVQRAPESVRELKVLDPAVGSGHFLVVAFDLLFALYQEEARHRGEEGEERWEAKAITERILEHNLHGLDLDPRAVQIAAAALWLKAQQRCADARPARLNLVASNLRLATLPDDDPALVELRREVERATGIPAALTDTLVHALKGADHLGSLLRVDAAVEEAIRQHEAALKATGEPAQGGLFTGPAAQQVRLFDAGEARQSVLGRLEAFLASHTGSEELGLRLRGEQLAAGVRFVRLVREGSYDLVVGNPPYQGTSKLADAGYVAKEYPRGKADLYAAFLERGLQLVREGGASAMVTMRNWMFLKQYADLRLWLFESCDLRALGDVSWGAFEEMRDNPVVLSIVRRASQLNLKSVAVDPSNAQERIRTREELQRKRAGMILHAGRCEFAPASLRVVPEWPLVYWWDKEFLRHYSSSARLGETTALGGGANSGANSRLNRLCWELRPGGVSAARLPDRPQLHRLLWAPYIKGGKDRQWIEPLLHAITWKHNGLQAKLNVITRFGESGLQWKICNERYYFDNGAAFTAIGSSFRVRAHRYSSIIDMMGQSVYGMDPAVVACLLHAPRSRHVMESLNPTVHFQVGDVRRIPVLLRGDEKDIFTTVEIAFTEHESHREPSVEFHTPGPSPWRYAQEWAQAAVDRPEGVPLPPYEPEYDPEPPTDHVSFALGVALGRFGHPDAPAKNPRATTTQSDNGAAPPPEPSSNILDPQKDDLSKALPQGILFLDGSLDDADLRDSLGHPASAFLHDTWKTYGPDIDSKRPLREYLRTQLFEQVHRKMYENRPIHWPLSSAKKTFVAWVNIHRWDASTLKHLLADHLYGSLRRLEGELEDLKRARDGADKAAAREAEGRYAKVQGWREELQAFIEATEECAERGAPPTDAKCPARERDTPYAPDLDDGVMINSAALWPLLAPQWKDPKKWWKELATAGGKKDYDWAHLAMRYWPTRVDEKCRKDPSLGVAHGCFWRYHPERAWAWELRLQDEIGAEFRIEEGAYDGDGGDQERRAAWLSGNPELALAAVEKEVLRRRKKYEGPVEELRLLEGLWSAAPAACWGLEMRLCEKLQVDFYLRGPDDEAARGRFLAEHTEEGARRARLTGGFGDLELFGKPKGKGRKKALVAEG